MQNQENESMVWGFTKNRLFFWGSVFSLLGTIVGAGIFGLPYIFSKIGWQVSLAFFIFLAAIILLVHFNYVFVVLRTEGKHRLAGYAQIHLGNWAKVVEVFSTIIGYTGGLLVYGILAGDFLSKLIPGSSAFQLSILFFLVGGILICLKQSIFLKVESILAFSVMILFLTIIFYGWGHINISNLLNYEPLTLKYLFLAYGAILFSLSGVVVIPEIVGSFFNANLNNVSFKYVLKIVLVGTLLAAVITLLFSFVVVGISGGNTSLDSLSGMGHILGNWVVISGSVIGFLAVTTSFIPFGLNARHVLAYDFGFSKTVAILIVTFLPLCLFLLGLRSFIPIIGTLGAVFGGIDSVLILMIAIKIRKKIKTGLSFIDVLSYFAALVFLVGIILEIYFLFS